jgi:hypothetical protein
MNDVAGTERGTALQLISWPPGQRQISDSLSAAIVAANQVSIWIATKLDAVKIERLPTDKRVQLASACHHVAIEHHAAIVLLAVQGIYGSTTALVRPAIESCFRGLWLDLVASAEQLDAVGRDERDAFPGFNRLVREIETASSRATGKDKPGLEDALKGAWWGRLCSYTHSGYQQIGARLTASGLGSAYTDDEIQDALRIAGAAAMMSSAGLAALAENAALAQEMLDGFHRF